MSKKKRCKKEDTDCKEMCHTCEMERCGTGDTGCKGPAMCHMSSSMCNGVFAPVCAPEVCNVPRIPHHEVLVDGQGILLDTQSQKEICFTIFVEREMQVYKGELELQDIGKEIKVRADVLKFFESNGKTHMLAIFHEEASTRDIVITVYQEEQSEQEKEKEKEKEQGHQVEQGNQRHPGHEERSTQIFIYSTSVQAGATNLGGALIAGDIKLYIDHNVHEH
ncbi:hypothetical protein QTL86_14145 [Cellulosilyticum sp. ST5]|uniref:hypothetical protein n=1 Tax=Cellulosilyticum sp. ST5 TaxID=3055805 RepID=UPI0039773CD8